MAGVALAVSSAAAALLLTLGLHTVFPTPLFFASIVGSTWYGGAPSGLLATLLAAAALDFYFVPPVHTLGGKAGELSFVIQFLIPALVTCWFVKMRREAVASLQHAHDELELRVQDRTAELRAANEELRRQSAVRIKAEETVERMQAELAHVSRVMTLGELAASIAHEVNQPLMAVVVNGDACLQWLERDPPDLGEARAAVGRIIGEGNRAAEIIRRIRAMFQKSPPQKLPVEINELIRDIAAMTRREMARSEVNCDLDLAPGLPPVLADRVQLQQVVLNLVMNGIEAMNASPLPRRLFCQTSRDGAGDVLVSVRDTGRGLPPGACDRVFQAFFTTKANGLGMGLSISRSIVEAHGGKISATDTGSGALFQIRLPAWKGPAQ